MIITRYLVFHKSQNYFFSKYLLKIINLFKLSLFIYENNDESIHFGIIISIISGRNCIDYLFQILIRWMLKLLVIILHIYCRTGNLYKQNKQIRSLSIIHCKYSFLRENFWKYHFSFAVFLILSLEFSRQLMCI